MENPPQGQQEARKASGKPPPPSVRSSQYPMSPSLRQAGLANKAQGAQTPQVGVNAGPLSQKVHAVALQTSDPRLRAGQVAV